jgi:hypothetical protein
MKVITETRREHKIGYLQFYYSIITNKGNNNITQLRTILQRKSQNS